MAGRRTSKGSATYNGLTTQQLRGMQPVSDAVRRANLASSKKKASAGPRRPSNLNAARAKQNTGARLCVYSLKNRTIVAEYTDGSTGGAARKLAAANGLPEATAKSGGQYTVSDQAVVAHIRQAIANGSTTIRQSFSGKKCGPTQLR